MEQELVELLRAKRKKLRQEIEVQYSPETAEQRDQMNVLDALIGILD